MPNADWTDQAETDLELIGYYVGVEMQNPIAADRILDQLRAKAEAYARQPSMGTLHEDIELPGEGVPVRSFRYKSYLAFYQETPNGIAVLRVIDGRRDYAALF